MSLFGSASAAQKPAAGGTSAQAPANGFSVMIQALTKATAVASVEAGAVPQVLLKTAVGTSAPVSALPQVAPQIAAAKAPPASSDGTEDDAAGTAGAGAEGVPEQIVPGEAGVDQLVVATPEVQVSPKAAPHVEIRNAVATAVTSSVPQQASLNAEPGAVQRPVTTAANVKLNTGQQVTGPAGQLLPQTVATKNPAPTHQPVTQSGGQVAPTAVVPASASAPVQVAVEPDVVIPQQNAGATVPPPLEKPPVAVAPQAAVALQPTRPPQSPVPTEGTKQEQTTGKAAIEKRQPTPPVSVPTQLTEPNSVPTLKAAVETTTSAAPIERSTTQPTAVAQTAPALTGPLGTAWANQRRMVVRDADPAQGNKTSVETDRLSITTDLKSVRSESLLRTTAVEPTQPKPQAPTFVGAAEGTALSSGLIKPEQPGVSPLGTIGITPHDEGRAAQPMVLAPQPTELRAATPLDQSTSATPKAPAKPMADALMAQVRSVDVQEGRTTVNLHPRGLGTIEVELIAERDAASKVIVRVENPLVLQTLREERQLLAQTIGIADSSVMSFEESATGERSFAGADDDAQAQGTFATDTSEEQARTHTNVVDDGVLDVLT